MRRSIFLRVVVVVIGTCTILLAIELIARLAFPSPAPESCFNCFSGYLKDSPLGFLPKPNRSFAVEKRCGDSQCFRTYYAYDEHRRRTSGLPTLSSFHLAIFGCSNTFGVGLAEQDTLSGILQTLGPWRAYNYGSPGRSPAFAHAILDQRSLTQELPGAYGAALYNLLAFQWPREILSSAAHWAWQNPGYTYPSAIGPPRFWPSLGDSNPWLVAWYKRYLSVHKQSRLLQILDRHFSEVNQADAEGILALNLLYAKILYEAEFPGPFLVIAQKNSYPAPSPNLAYQLKRLGIPLIWVEIEKPGREALRLCPPCDNHPGPLYNLELARQIAEQLRVAIMSARVFPPGVLLKQGK